MDFRRLKFTIFWNTKVSWIQIKSVRAKGERDMRNQMNAITIDSIKIPVWIAKSSQFDGSGCANRKIIWSKIFSMTSSFTIVRVWECVGGCRSGQVCSAKQVFCGRVNFTQWTALLYVWTFHTTQNTKKIWYHPMIMVIYSLTAPHSNQYRNRSEASVAHCLNSSTRHFQLHKRRQVMHISRPLSATHRTLANFKINGREKLVVVGRGDHFTLFQMAIAFSHDIDVRLSHKCNKCVCLMRSVLQRFDSSKWKFNHQRIMIELIGVEHSPSIDYTEQIMRKK